MNETRRPSWIRAAVPIGLAYAVVGIAFAWPTTHVHAWRLAAWLVSAAVFAAHIAYERYGLRSAPAGAASHVALAVALGGFGLAVGATVHSFSVGATSQHRRLVLIALAAWPILTGLPAFLVAFASSHLLARVRWSARAG